MVNVDRHLIPDKHDYDDVMTPKTSKCSKDISRWGLERWMGMGRIHISADREDH